MVLVANAGLFSGSSQFPTGKPILSGDKTAQIKVCTPFLK